MKVKAYGSYRNAKGTLVFLYAAISWTPAQVEAYKAAQGDNFRAAGPNDGRGIPEGTPLYFSTRTMGAVGTIGITSKGKIFADMSEYETTANLVAQFGGNFGQELAKVAAAKLMGVSPVVAETAAAPVAVSTANANLSNPE